MVMASLMALKSTNDDLDMVLPWLLLIVMNCVAQAASRFRCPSYRRCRNHIDGKNCRWRQRCSIQQTASFTRLAGLPDWGKQVAGQNGFVGKEEQAMPALQL